MIAPAQPPVVRHPDTSEPVWFCNVHSHSDYLRQQREERDGTLKLSETTGSSRLNRTDIRFGNFERIPHKWQEHVDETVMKVSQGDPTPPSTAPRPPRSHATQHTRKNYLSHPLPHPTPCTIHTFPCTPGPTSPPANSRQNLQWVKMNKGDVVLVDNYMTMHGRNVFEGVRKHAVTWFK